MYCQNYHFGSVGCPLVSVRVRIIEMFLHFMEKQAQNYRLILALPAFFESGILNFLTIYRGYEQFG